MSVDTEMKICRKCHLEQPIINFGPEKRGLSGVRAQCKSCEAARVRAYYASNEAYRAKAKANSKKQNLAHPATPEQSRRVMLRHKYDLSESQYEAILRSQGECCALCGIDNVGRWGGKSKWYGHWNVDHCHSDGRVRGLLCHSCNVSLGTYERLLERAGEDRLLDYLTRPSPVLQFMTPVIVPPEYRKVAPPPRYTTKYADVPCSVEGCETQAQVKGMCSIHYTRFMNNGSTSDDTSKRGARGESNRLAKLTEANVTAIRESTEKGVVLAERYGVTATQISNIRLRKTWKHVA